VQCSACNCVCRCTALHRSWCRGQGGGRLQFIVGYTTTCAVCSAVPEPQSALKCRVQRSHSPHRELFLGTGTPTLHRVQAIAPVWHQYSTMPVWQWHPKALLSTSATQEPFSGWRDRLYGGSRLNGGKWRRSGVGNIH
jgi:hypothetical protein